MIERFTLMKYTPAELIQFVRDEQLEPVLQNAIMNNTKDFHLYRTNGRIVPIGGQLMYDFNVGNDIDPIPLKDYCTPDQINTLVSHPECIRSGLVFRGGEIQFVFTFSPDEEEKEQEEEFWNHVYTMLCTMLKLDTRGRLLKFMQPDDNTGSMSDNGGVTVFRPTAPVPGR